MRIEPDFNMIPNTGFAVANVIVDGNSVGAATSYTFTNIGDDHTISATFVDVAGPSAQVIDPNGGESWIGTTHRVIHWTANDTRTGRRSERSCSRAPTSRSR